MDISLTSLIGWIIFGLIIGALARLIMPGRDPMGWIATIVLGIVGSLVGGFLAYALHLGHQHYEAGGWIMSLIGAVIALAFYYWTTGGRRRI